MAPIVTTGQVVWTVPGSGVAVLRVGQGLLLLARDDLGEGDILELTITPGSEYGAVADDRCSQATWVLLFGPLGHSAITLPRGSCVAPRVDITARPVPLETSEGFDLDPDTSDPSVPAAGPEPIDLESLFSVLSAA